MPTYTITDPQSGRTMRVTGDSPPTEAELESLFGGAEKPAARTWGDTLTDALPLAGGIVGGVVGAAGGIPGVMAGSALGGGFGEAARQRLTQDEYDFGDIATTGLAEGATAGAFGLAGKGAARIIRGVKRANITPTDVMKGAASSLVSKEMPIIGAVRSGIERASESRMAREALGSGRLNRSRVEKLDDVLTQALDDVRAEQAPMRVGGSGSPLRAGKNPVVNAERTGDLISTQPDKWGTTSLHTADRLDDALRPSQGQLRTSNQASDFMMAKRAARLPDAAPGAQSTLADDAFTRYSRGNPQQQELLQELLRADRASVTPASSHLTKAGRSMMTDDDTLLLEKALRDMQANLARVPQSRTMRRQ